MPNLSDEAICVRHWDFSETSQTVSLLTRSHGMLRGLAKGAKRSNGAFSGGIDLLTRGRVAAIVKPGRELSTLTEWDLLENFRAVRQRLDANRAAFYMAELVCRMIVDNEPHGRSYDALVTGLRAVADADAIDAALVRFQWTLLDEGGVRPRIETESKAATLAFSPREGLLEVAGADGARGGRDAADVTNATDGTKRTHATIVTWPVRRETIALLRSLADHDRIDPATGESVRRAGRLLAAYIRELLGTEPPTMRAVYGEIATGRR